MKTKTVCTLLIILTLIISCQNKEKESLEEPIDMTQFELASSEYEVSKEEVSNQIKSSKEKSIKNSNSSKKKIIKDGNLSIKTNDLNKSKALIDNILKKINGYYETENFNNEYDLKSFNLKIRIPSQRFEKLITEIEEGENEIIDKSINTRDVTSEYFDIESRLSNKRGYLKRYKELLVKANSIKDILAIEEKIRILEEEIESKEGQLKYLSDQIDYSTLDLYIFKEKDNIEKNNEDSFLEKALKSLGNGWKLIVDFLLWLVSIWPFIIISSILTIGIRKYLKKRALKNLNKK